MNKMKNTDGQRLFEEKIARMLKSECVPEIEQSEIEATCRAASSHYVQKQKILDAGFWRVVVYFRSVGDALFYIASTFIFGGAVSVLGMSTSHTMDPTALMTSLSPVPLISFALHELHNSDRSTAEIEKTCKYTPDRICFARLWLCIIFNSALVLLAGVTLFPHYGFVVRLYLSSFSAMFLVGAAALFLMSVTSSRLPLSIMMLIWLVGSGFFLADDKHTAATAAISTWQLALILVFSVAVFAAVSMNAARRLYKTERRAA